MKKSRIDISCMIIHADISSKPSKADRTIIEVEPEIVWKYSRFDVIQKKASFMHLPTPQFAPPNDGIATIRLREIGCDIVPAGTVELVS